MSKLTKTVETIIYLSLSWAFTGFILGKGLYLIFGYSIAVKENGCMFIGYFLSTLIIIFYLFVKLLIFIIKAIKQKNNAHAMQTDSERSANA